MKLATSACVWQNIAFTLLISLTSGSMFVANVALAEDQNNPITAQLSSKPVKQFSVVKYNNNIQKTPIAPATKFTIEPNLSAGKYTYIVELSELSLAQEPNSVKELLAAKQQNRSTNVSQAFAIRQQLDKIEQQQQRFLDKASAQIQGIKAITRFKYGLNGLTASLSQAQAQTLSLLPQVKRIRREKSRRLYTDRGPVLIGAPKVWDATAFPNIEQTQGEGIVIGIIDSGINTNHPSFAEVSGDGYLHTNPLGNGVYLGDCAGSFAELCNSKLIGVYSYSQITNKYSDTSIFPPSLPRNGEDYGGHGSHVASIAAGNVLKNVAEVYPTEGEERSTGTETGFVFTQISGVAPRANIISYQVCFGGTKDREDEYADCLDSPILQAIDDAIRDNVDVINFSISGGGDPWSDTTEQAFLSARNAGIFVATSAGNDGPQASTSEKNAPWYTSVAASEHGRENVYLKELNGFSGGNSTLSPIVGQSNTGSITASIVYAGNYPNANDPTGDSAQCLEPFPAGTFNGQIVVCDRGDIARVQKAINVRDGGAGGYVLANIGTGESFLANDQYVIPGIHINEDNGDILKAWLAGGENHRATISLGQPAQFIDESRVDVIADYSSRGPSVDFSLLIPTLTAPGTDIYAAYADEQLGHDGHEPAASNFSTLRGTSMSSPHVAGAAALVKALNPSFSADEIRSALALTTTSAMKKEDASSDATFFDMGAGRIQVDKAIASPLVMNETAENYVTANPETGGDPRTLNLPSITDNQCTGSCNWTRKFTATVDATFDFELTEISQGVNIEVTPASFTLLKGQTQSVLFAINSTQASKVDYSFAIAKFTSPGLPDVNIPVSILSSIGDIPASIEIDGRRATDTAIIENIEAVNVENFELTEYMPVKATLVEGFIAEDTDRSSFLDDLSDGVSMTTVLVTDNARRLITELEGSNEYDLDLFVLFDANENGVPDSSEEIARSELTNSDEEVSINYPLTGTYFIIVQNFSSSTNIADAFELRHAIVSNELAGSSLTVQAPNSLDANIPFDIRVTYDLPLAISGDYYYGAVAMGSSAGLEDLGLIAVDINRIDNDVYVNGPATRLNAGESVALSIIVESNPTEEDREYTVVLPLPVGTEFTSFSTSNNGQLINNEVVWTTVKPAGGISDTVLNFTLKMLNGIEAGPVDVIVNSQLSEPITTSLEAGETFTDIQIEGSPVISINGSSIAEFVITETQTLVIPLSINEPNDDEVTVQFRQTSGPTANIAEADDMFTLVAPLVESDTQLSYDISVSDQNGNTATGSINVNVLNNGTPIIGSIDAPNSANGGQNITITVNATDPENDSVEIRINGRVISGNSIALRTPTVGASVTYDVIVSDGITQASESITVSLTQTASSSGGGSMSWWIIMLLPLALSRRYSWQQTSVNCKRL